VKTFQFWNKKNFNNSNKEQWRRCLRLNIITECLALWKYSSGYFYQNKGGKIRINCYNYCRTHHHHHLTIWIIQEDIVPTRMLRHCISSPQVSQKTVGKGKLWKYICQNSFSKNSKNSVFELEISNKGSSIKWNGPGTMCTRGDSWSYVDCRPSQIYNEEPAMRNLIIDGAAGGETKRHHKWRHFSFVDVAPRKRSCTFFYRIFLKRKHCLYRCPADFSYEKPMTYWELCLKGKNNAIKID
jgi:hypothetical protein